MMKEKRKPITRTLYAAGARWHRAGDPYYCIQCGVRLYPQIMTPYQFDLWEKTDLCKHCQTETNP